METPVVHCTKVAGHCRSSGLPERFLATGVSIIITQVTLVVVYHSNGNSGCSLHEGCRALQVVRAAGKLPERFLATGVSII